MIRESASAGVIWKCWSNISFRLDSAILLSASRRLPLYPKPSALAPGANGGGGGGDGDGERGRAAGEREGNVGSGAEAPDRGSANTLLPPPFSYLTSPHLSPQPALPIEPSSTPSWLVLLLPRPPPMSLDWPTPDCGSSKMTNCLAKQSGMRNSKNTRIKVLARRDYSYLSPLFFTSLFVSGIIFVKKISSAEQISR